MLVFRALWAALSVLPIAMAATSVPVGFEKSDDCYAAQQMGRAIRVCGSGAAILANGHEVRMDVVGAARKTRLSGEGDAGIRNEYIGSDASKWRTGIHLSAAVTAHGIYPGIDMVWYGRGSQLEYDFNVQPDADPRKIRMRLAGADRVEVNGAGDVVISDGQGTIVQKVPSAYQMIGGVRREVAVGFRLSAGYTLAFHVGAYDRSAGLTIDPAIQLSSYVGGKSADEMHAVAVDSSGNFFLAGQTYSTLHGNSNVMIFEATSTGTYAQTVIGGTLGTDIANGIAVDSSGDVFVVGSTTSTDFPIAGQFGIQSQVFGQQKAILIGLTASLKIGYSGYFGGSYTDQANAIAVGPNDNLFIVGDTTSIDFLQATNIGTLINSNAFQDSNHGGDDAFLMSVTAAGVFNFATYIGGTAEDHAYGVAVDANSNVYVVGSTASSDFPSYPDSTSEATAFDLYHGNQDGFAIKLTATADTYGSAGEWSIFIGGTNEDVANAVALDSNGNPYITGTTGSTDFPVGGGGYQITYQGGTSDGFVFALHSDGLHGYWSTFLGSSTQDTLNSIAVDSGGNIYVTGTSDGTNYPVTTSALQAANAGGQDVILTELNNNGTSVLYSTYYGGTGNDVGRAVTVDGQGSIYFAGITSSSNYPVTTGTYQKAYGGGTTDGFFSILGCPSGTPAIAAGGIGNAASYSTTTVSPGGIFAIFGSFFSCVGTSASAVPLVTTLNGVTVKVNGTAVPLYYAGEGQINAQLPYETAVGTATVTVETTEGTSASVSIPVVTAGPGIFLAETQAAAVNSDGTLNTATNGAAKGSHISVYFTGTGPLNNAVATGAAAPSSPYSEATTKFTATINGQAATVIFLGLAPGFVGLGQANITVPDIAVGNYALVITINGVASNSGLITVSN